MKLASFDIFDTTLIRKCGKPENIFYLLAKRLYPDNSAKADDFFLWRCQAEGKAASATHDINVTLSEIYDNPDVAGFSEYTVEQLMAAEKSVEKDNLMVNPAVKKIIEGKRQDGYQVCFISDMYLNSDFLSEKLREEACLLDGEKVYVSCEKKARKSDCKLYEFVKSELKPTIWEHYGDNAYSDVKMAKKCGIKAFQINTSFTDVEKRILAKSKEFRQSYEMSILAGLSRAERIEKNNNPFAVIAADYVAPAYLPYVKFVLEQAQRDGIQQLYFLSRDSYVLLRAAQQMSDKYTDIDLRYLFVSRKSLMLPYMTDMSVDSFLAAQDKNTVMRKNVSSLLASLGVDETLLADHGIEFNYKKITSKEQETDFLDKVFNSSLTTVLKKLAVERHSLLLSYFEQEGLLNGKKSAMVDVGWLGTSRLMINSILKLSGHDEVMFYYYGIRGDVFHSQYGNYSSYFHSGQLNTETTALIENYFSASPYPTTLGYYRDEDGKIHPTFPDGKEYKKTEITVANINAIEWIAEGLHSAGIDDDALLFAWASIALDSLSTLKDKIDLSAFVTSDDFDSTAFVRKLSFKELFELVCLGKHITAFDKASLQLTVGYGSLSLLWPLRNFTGRLRRLLYLRFGS